MGGVIILWGCCCCGQNPPCCLPKLTAVFLLSLQLVFPTATSQANPKRCTLQIFPHLISVSQLEFLPVADPFFLTPGSVPFSTSQCFGSISTWDARLEEEPQQLLGPLWFAFHLAGALPP